jgi:hypothetical protein
MAPISSVGSAAVLGAQAANKADIAKINLNRFFITILPAPQWPWDYCYYISISFPLH